MNGWYLRQGRPDHAGLPDPRGHPVPLRARRRLHHRRRLPLLGAQRDRPEPHLPVVGTINADQAPRQTAPFIRLQRRRRAAASSCLAVLRRDAAERRRDLEDLPGQRQLRRQRRAVLQTFADLDPSQGGTAPGPGHQPALLRQRHGHRPGAVAGSRTRNADNIATAIKADVMAGTLPQVSWVVDQPAVLRAPRRRADRRRLLHRPGAAHGARRRPGRVQLDAVHLQLRRERRRIRPRAAAVPRRQDSSSPARVLSSSTSFEPPPLPVGLGFRVPCILISPWTRGGWVTSEVSDHTSVIQFLEKWTAALGKPAISPEHQRLAPQGLRRPAQTRFDFDHPGLRPAGPARITAPRSARRRVRHPAGHQRDARRRSRAPSQPARCPTSRTPTSTGFTNSDGAVQRAPRCRNNAPWVRRPATSRCTTTCRCPGHYGLPGARSPASSRSGRRRTATREHQGRPVGAAAATPTTSPSPAPTGSCAASPATPRPPVRTCRCGRSTSRWASPTARACG